MSLYYFCKPTSFRLLQDATIWWGRNAWTEDGKAVVKLSDNKNIIRNNYYTRVSPYLFRNRLFYWKSPETWKFGFHEGLIVTINLSILPHARQFSCKTFSFRISRKILILFSKMLFWSFTVYFKRNRVWTFK